MFDWGNAPAGSVAQIYLPGVVAADISGWPQGCTRRRGSPCWTPTPCAARRAAPRGCRFPRYILRQLRWPPHGGPPPGVRKGQAYTVVGAPDYGLDAWEVNPGTVSARPSAAPAARTAPALSRRRVLGSFQLTIPVAPEEMLARPSGAAARDHALDRRDEAVE